VTALYTSGAWSWGRLPGAELLASREAKAAFDGTNLVLAVTSLFASGPSLRCSLIQRHLMIDRLLADAGAKHVLELAAGLSPPGGAGPPRPPPRPPPRAPAPRRPPQRPPPPRPRRRPPARRPP